MTSAVPLAKLTSLHLSHLYAAPLSEGYAPSTIARPHAIRKGALKQAVRWQLLARNVADAVRAPAIAPHTPTV